MVECISILGSTGSIGRQTVRAALDLGIKVAALTAGKNIRLLEEQARLLKPDFISVSDEESARELKIALGDPDIAVGWGEDGLVEAATMPRAQAVVTAVSGAVGLIPTLAAIREKKRIALANKETLVCAGDLVMAAARESGSEIIPVDSEHSAIFQCLQGRGEGELRKILLTASGGPFLRKNHSELQNITPAQAVAHPNWSMGAKISVDSATMMNKGLEFIEAMHLFGVHPDEIEVLIHPQSVVHSMVELIDGAVIAQLGVPDMGLPIRYALTYPKRAAVSAQRLDFTKASSLTFEKPDLGQFPCLGLAMDCARRGGTAPAVMNAANEEAVGLFLAGRIGFNQIYDCVLSALDSIEWTDGPDLPAILAADRAARAHVKAVF